MAIHTVTPGQPLARPKGIETRNYRFPAPQRGIDARAPLAEGRLDVCSYTYNLVPDDGGLKRRKGFREWQIDLENSSAESVNTVIPYDGLAADGSDDRLFAVTNEGIWDVTTAAAAPTLKFTFSNQTSDAGFGVYATFISDAGDKYLFYADSLNGLFTYDSGADTWAQTTGITGATAANVNFIAIHKQRIWLIERDSPDAWYLGIGAVTGAATKFYFGSKLKRGGALRGLFNWTVDGGAGVDDMLVGVSGAGDVIVYQGSDPSSLTTWEVRGVYFIGSLPKGPKFGTEEGGELYLLSTYGLISMGDLLKGVNLSSMNSNTTTAQVSGIIRIRMSTDSDLNGWSVRAIPSEGGLLVSSPIMEGKDPIQYYYNTTVQGWGFWRDLDIRSFATWKNAVIFGDSSLRVCSMDRSADNVLITPPAAPEFNGSPVKFSTLTSFSSFGLPGMFKVALFIRPDTVGLTEPAFTAAARYDFLSQEPSAPLATTPDKIALWDVDNWDAAVWGPDPGTGWNTVYGASGIGRNVAIAYRGEAYDEFTLIGWDIMFKSGGSML